MTTLHKTVKRETESRYQGRNIIVSIEPPGTLGFREKGRRRTFYLSVSTAYLMAARLAVEAERDARKARRKGGAR